MLTWVSKDLRFFLFDEKGALLRQDVEKWFEWREGRGSENEEELAQFLEKMLSSWEFEFRNIVDFRLGQVGWWSLRPHLQEKRQEALTIACDAVGGGLVVQNGHATNIYAKSIGKSFWVSQLVTVGEGKGGAPTIGDHVTILPGAVVTGGITIGHGATIGPNAVVDFDVPDRARVDAPRAVAMLDGRQVNVIETPPLPVPDGPAYDDEFYEGHLDDSLMSARIYLAHLWQYFQPRSVLDFGCGRGAWLKVCHELGAATLFGLDGDWNDQSQMLDQATQFRSVDLDAPFDLPARVDMAMTLEVAEHLKPSSAAGFVDCLVKASDVVLFGAAYTDQGGTNHINERPHTYWAALFIQRGYVPVDLFRPFFWGNEDVRFWYRQNTFLYLKKDSAAYRRFTEKGFSELINIAFMDCVHPRLYERKCQP